MGVEELLESREEKLVYYSPYSFVREIKPPDQFDLFVRPKIDVFGTTDSQRQFTATVAGMDFVFLYEYLPWDSQYFAKACFKLFTVLFSRQHAPALVQAIHLFRSKLQKSGAFYCFSEIPSEDIFLIQCLNEAGVRLVETRLHYFRRKTADVDAVRYAVREATAADIPALSSVAASNRNSYDRLHADYTFSDMEADRYLATYAEAAVNGFCDHVFVPDVPGLPVASFIAFDHDTEVSPKHLFEAVRIKLSAAAPENKGWLFKLLSEVICYAEGQKECFFIYPTQATNRAALRVCEKLGFSYGAASHIFAFGS
ncbi:hypothetical protein EFA69_07010 [Rufibacter immobilis]|uniref:Uncharacterized protein n=1 Tax=Rufibacter immobilis TaxID=1348778 RepID=A0A3M9MZE0_9BACT|nr:hypothetical protein [Rufibacter immobilis]RNI30846.1 hypothetical protein EFA69_07010 [Rufibacter immobilis]